MVSRSRSRSTPTPLVALAWGSASTSRVRFSAAASDAARLTADVVLPTPPFWFAIAMTRPMRAGIYATGGGGDRDGIPLLHVQQGAGGRGQVRTQASGHSGLEAGGGRTCWTGKGPRRTAARGPPPPS